MEQYAAHGQLWPWSSLAGELAPGGPTAIAAGTIGTEAVTVEPSALDHAAIESGTD